MASGIRHEFGTLLKGSNIGAGGVGNARERELGNRTFGLCRDGGDHCHEHESQKGEFLHTMERFNESFKLKTGSTTEHAPRRVRFQKRPPIC